MTTWIDSRLGADDNWWSNSFIDFDDSAEIIRNKQNGYQLTLQ